MEQIEYQPTYVEELAHLDALAEKIVDSMLDDEEDAIEAFYDIILNEIWLSLSKSHYSWVGKDSIKDAENELNESMTKLAKTVSGGDVKNADGAIKPIAIAKKFGRQLFDLYNRIRMDIQFNSVKEWGGQLMQLDAYFFGLDKGSPYSIRERFFMFFELLRQIHFDLVVNVFDSMELRNLIRGNKKQDGES